MLRSVIAIRKSCHQYGSGRFVDLRHFERTGIRPKGSFRRRRRPRALTTRWRRRRSRRPSPRRLRRSSATSAVWRSLPPVHQARGSGALGESCRESSCCGGSRPCCKRLRGRGGLLEGPKWSFCGPCRADFGTWACRGPSRRAKVVDLWALSSRFGGPGRAGDPIEGPKWSFCGPCRAVWGTVGPGWAKAGHLYVFTVKIQQ